MKIKSKLIFGTLVIVLSVSVFFSFSRTALSAETYNAEKERAYFKGKVVNIIVPSKAGGWFDIWARLVQPAFREKLKTTVVVSNIVGGARKKAMNQLFSAPPDGTVFGVINRANMVTEMIGEEGVHYKCAEYTWLANVSNEGRYFFVNQQSPYKNFRDIINTNDRIKFGTNGTGSVSWYDILMLKKVFNKKNIAVVTAYEGTADIYRAIIMNEVNSGIMAGNEIENRPKTEIRVLLQLGGKKAYNPGLDVTTFAEIAPPEAKDYVKLLDDQFYMSRFWAAPPKMAPNRARFMRDTFEEICKDPKFVAMVKKMGASIDFTRGEKVQEMVRGHMKQPQWIVDLFKTTEDK
jgi:tripartite-type tricarboxylate transporter receptor subunit TctC